MGLRVKGKHLSDEQKVVGYYNLARIRAGQEFEIDDESHFSGFWMEPIGWEPRAKSTQEREREQQEYTRKLHAIATGSDAPAALREQSVEAARARDAARAADPSDVGALPPRAARRPNQPGV